MNQTEQLVRLSKRMSELGFCSRREADEWIERGWVQVDGVVINQLGSKVLPSQKITVSSEARKQQLQLATILVHKPVGYVSAQEEDGYIPAVRLIQKENQFAKKDRILAENHFDGLAVVGRLDIDSQGLLIFTQDGRLAKKIIGENSNIEKEYLVRVEGHITDETLEQLRFGLSLDDKPLKPAVVEWVNEDQLRFVLKEGRKRQIRRMLDLVNVRITGLKRVRVGNIMLGNLPEGKWRFLNDDENF